MQVGGEQSQELTGQVPQEKAGDGVGLARVGVGLDGNQEQVHEEDNQVHTEEILQPKQQADHVQY